MEVSKMTQFTLTNPTLRPEMNPLIEVNRLVKGYKLPGGKSLNVLENIDFTLYEGEIVALLGKSGSGKSTMLRILAGLIPPTQGHLRYRRQTVNGPLSGVAMVFQSFALLPWLTVQQNVELGLEAQGVPRKERARRAVEAIDLIGMDGFEGAYPKELSGGMRQRVGLARALVVQPDALFMDEPFSALDVLTAENLRNEIIELWMKGQFPAKSILIVTHNIEEAVYLADRIVVLGSNPGRLRAVIKNDLPHWRDHKSAKFTGLVDQIYQIMTHPEVDVDDLLAAYRDRQNRKSGEPALEIDAGNGLEEPEQIAQALLGSDSEAAQYFRLPQAKVDGMNGLLEYLDENAPEGRDDIYRLADELHFEADDLLPITDALDLLDLAEVKNGDVTLTETGRIFAKSDLEPRKEIFRQQLLGRIPLAENIYLALSVKESHRLEAEFFREVLQRRFTEQEAERQLETLIDWGRYAELFEYDADNEILFLPVQESADN
jgi:NitT/TauT family transport system ATP-binding protein